MPARTRDDIVAIHPGALVDPSAEIDLGVEIGPFSVIGPGVKIGRNTTIGAYVAIERWTVIGERNRIHNYSCIGSPSQDLKWGGERAYVRIGDDNIIREFTTINRATGQDQATVLGDRNCLLAYAHVAHNCRLGSDIIMSNYAGIAGNVVLEDCAILGGLAGVHQFCRVGRHALVGGLTKVCQDVPPYCIADGHPARFFGANTVGLRRRHFPEAEIHAIKQAYRILFGSPLDFARSLSQIESELNGSPACRDIIEFSRASERGIVHPRRR